jgi:hypothetical protein
MERGSLQFSAGAHSLGSTSVITAQSRVVVAGGAVSVYGRWGPELFTETSGTLSFYVFFQSSDPSLTISGGTLNFIASARLVGLTLQNGAILSAADGLSVVNISDVSLLVSERGVGRLPAIILFSLSFVSAPSRSLGLARPRSEAPQAV